MPQFNPFVINSECTAPYREKEISLDDYGTTALGDFNFTFNVLLSYESGPAKSSLWLRGNVNLSFLEND